MSKRNIKKKEKQQNKELAILGGVTLVAILIFLLMTGVFNQTQSEDSVCSSCHKTFTNRDDTRSIALTNMCEQCYDNFKFSQKILKEAEKYQERY